MPTRFYRRNASTEKCGTMGIAGNIKTILLHFISEDNPFFAEASKGKGTKKEDGMAQARRTAGMDLNTYAATQFVFKCPGEGGSPITLVTIITPKPTYSSLILRNFPLSISLFGVVLEDRDFSSSSYRYTFQNQEHDDELKGEGNSINFTYRMHDPRLGRFLSVDPLVKQFASISSYAFSENSVIAFIDLEGLEKFYAANGEFIGQLGNSDEKRFINQHDDNDTYTLNKFKREFKKYNKNPSKYLNSKQGQVFAEQAMKNSHPVFSSHYDAAFYWLNIYNKKSIDVNLEIGATIYSVEIDGKVYFNYYNTTVGEEHVIALTLKAPAGTKIRGSIHTHGDESGLSYSDNEFSGYFGELDKGEDIDAYENFYKMNKSITYHYLGTPNGSMLFFDVTKGINDHKTNSTTNFGKILHDDSAVKDKVIESSKKSNSK